jgi:hypothetical protein
VVDARSTIGDNNIIVILGPGWRWPEKVIIIRRCEQYRNGRGWDDVVVMSMLSSYWDLLFKVQVCRSIRWSLISLCWAEMISRNNALNLRCSKTLKSKSFSEFSYRPTVLSIAKLSQLSRLAGPNGRWEKEDFFPFACRDETIHLLLYEVLKSQSPSIVAYSCAQFEMQIWMHASETDDFRAMWVLVSACTMVST